MLSESKALKIRARSDAYANEFLYASSKVYEKFLIVLRHVSADDAPRYVLRGRIISNSPLNSSPVLPLQLVAITSGLWRSLSVAGATWNDNKQL